MTRLILSLALVLSVCSSSFAEWGTLKGRFVIKGLTAKQKKPAKLIVNKDVEVCAKHGLIDEALKVDDKGGLANVVMYARGSKTDALKPVAKIHPSYAKLKGTKVTFDNNKCRFSPHIQKVWTAQTLLITNSDKVAHNSFGSPFNNPAFNPLIVAGGKLEVNFKKPEKLPISIKCSVHPWMVGYVVVRPDPYAAVATKDGSFTIENLPVGKHHFQLWHEKLAYLKKINLGGKKDSDRKGLYEIEIKKGDNDIGDIVIDAKDFSSKLK